MDDEARGLYPRARERNMLMPAGAIEKDFQWASGLPCATSACSAAILIVIFRLSRDEQPEASSVR